MRISDWSSDVCSSDLEEVEQLLGEAFATAQAADEALEAFVFRAGPEQDAALIGLFHRRTMRALQMLRGYPGPIVERGPSPVDRAAFSLPGSDSAPRRRSEEHTSELQSLMRISYAVFCLKKKKNKINHK